MKLFGSFWCWLVIVYKIPQTDFLEKKKYCDVTLLSGKKLSVLPVFMEKVGVVLSLIPGTQHLYRSLIPRVLSSPYKEGKAGNV